MSLRSRVPVMLLYDRKIEIESRYDLDSYLNVISRKLYQRHNMCMDISYIGGSARPECTATADGIHQYS